MNNELIRKDYEKKINLLKKYNRKYFDENLSVISDSEYDKLKKEIIDLEKKK